MYGGDGITPDDTVGAAEYSRRQASLIDPIFVLAQAIVSGKGAFGASTGRPVSDSSAVESAAAAAQLGAFLARDNGWSISSDTVSAESKFIAARLRYYLVLARSGSSAARRVDLNDDPALARGLEMLPRAAELAKAAKRTQRAAANK